MTPEQREQMVRDGIERAHSFRSAGHWEAGTKELIAGWHAAKTKLDAADSVDLVFLASVSLELNAQVLRHREVKGPWSA